MHLRKVGIGLQRLPWRFLAALLLAWLAPASAMASPPAPAMPAPALLWLAQAAAPGTATGPAGKAAPAARRPPDNRHKPERRTLRVVQRTLRIGVLAYRGPRQAMQRWQPLLQCLDRSLPALHFTLVPVTLSSASDLLARQALDFLITNPGHYITLSRRFPLSAMATLVRFTADGQPVMRFGSVIFTRADGKLRDIADARGHVVAAVSDSAFGGFLVGWQVFRQFGMDLLDESDARMYFTGFPQDRIVSAVLEGKADVGIVRTGLLESLAHEGKLDLSRIRILNPVPRTDFPWRLSSQLYPEWPFVVRDGVNRRIAARVLAALLATMRRKPVCQLDHAWTAPLSYAAVETLVDAFHAAERARNQRGNWLLWVALLAVGVAAFAAAWLWRARQAEELRVQARVASGGITPEQRARFDDLTRRELQVLACLCEGLSSKEIAQHLGIAPKTVEYHRANLLKKTGFSSTTKMVALASRLGLDACPGKTRAKTGEAPSSES